MKKYNFIYKTTCVITGLIYVGRHSTDIIDDGYIGFGIGRHVKPNFITKTKFVLAVQKYGYENFKREILEFCNSECELKEREVFWQINLKCSNPNIGYNWRVTSIGGHPEGFRYSVESRNKIAQSKTGKKHDSDSIIVMKKSWELVKSKVCPFCNIEGRGPNMKRYHFDNCKLSPNYEVKADTRAEIICPHCGHISKNKGNMVWAHFDNCKDNPNHSIRQFDGELIICPYCNKKSKNKSEMTHYHFENCKSNPNRITDENTYSCIHCGLESKSKGNIFRWHNDRCPKRTSNL